ncbi:MAG: hypothetical protein M3N51_11745 [Actinomycetota bacterium]|nr:hypothetical protein [Actinomycetota bacterium]
MARIEEERGRFLHDYEDPWEDQDGFDEPDDVWPQEGPEEHTLVEHQLIFDLPDDLRGAYYLG